jgi:hypothetical protein
MAGALREGTGQISEVDSGIDFDFKKPRADYAPGMQHGH